MKLKSMANGLAPMVKNHDPAEDRGQVIWYSVLLEFIIRVHLGSLIRDLPTRFKLFGSPKGSKPDLDAGNCADLLYGLGFVGKTVYEDITTLFEIRNQFAHIFARIEGKEFKTIDFNHQAIATKCRHLKIPDRISEEPLHKLLGSGAETLSALDMAVPFNRYLTTVVAVLAILENGKRPTLIRSPNALYAQYL